MKKTYLAVPYHDKDRAKALGAKWDPEKKKWYAPNGETSLVEKWPIESPISGLVDQTRSLTHNDSVINSINNTSEAYFEISAAQLAGTEVTVKNDSKPTEIKSKTTGHRWLYAHNNSDSCVQDKPKSVGKWMLYFNSKEIDEKWAKVKQSVESGHLRNAKVSTANETNPDSHVIIVYTYDYNDLSDVIRVLNYLENSGLHNKNNGPIYYKTDRQTRSMVYAGSGHRPWIYASDTVRNFNNGNCLFQAVAEQLIRFINKNQQYNFKYNKLRELAVNRISYNPKDFPDELFTPKGRQHYLNEIAKDGQWAGEIEIRALADALKIQIEVTYPLTTHNVKPIVKTYGNQSERIVYLKFDGNKHYSYDPMIMFDEDDDDLYQKDEPYEKDDPYQEEDVNTRTLSASALALNEYQIANNNRTIEPPPKKKMHIDDDDDDDDDDDSSSQNDKTMKRSYTLAKK